jgi:ABC-2 type transport system ATP-binding protein
MSGAFFPDRGGELMKNRASLLLNLSVGLSHELTVRENMYVNGPTLVIRIKQIDNIFDEIVEFAELE